LKITGKNKCSAMMGAWIVIAFLITLIILSSLRGTVSDRGTMTFLNSDLEEWDDSRDGQFNIAFVPVGNRQVVPNLAQTVFYDCEKDNGKPVNLVFAEDYEIYVYEGYSKYASSDLTEPLFFFRYSRGYDITIVITSLTEITFTQVVQE